MIKLTKIVAELPDTVPFVGPEAQERSRGRPFLARIGANENVFGPSPKAIEAMKIATYGSWQYGDPENYDLINALAEYLGVDVSNVVIGEGIDCLLGYLVRMTVNPGDKIVSSDGAYPTFNYHVRGYGGVIVTVPYFNDHESPQHLVNCANEVNARLVYLANPDNPMGTWNSAETIDTAVAGLNNDCLMVLDEAYIECAPTEASPSFDVSNKKIIRMRTFSKAYGMAGMRVGYAVGHKDLIGAFNRIRNHFGMCRVSQAGALASLRDQSYLGETVAKIKDSRDKIASITKEAGLNPLPSAANFVAIDCGQDGNFSHSVLNQLIKRDIFVRMPFVAPQDRCIRISAGTRLDLDLLEKNLSSAVLAAKQQQI